MDGMTVACCGKEMGMRLQEMVRHVKYVSNPEGPVTAVQIDIDVWQEIVMLLQKVMPAGAVSSAISAYPVNTHRATMQREIAAYVAMHPTLVENYLGQYVAVYQGQLVDHDADAVALHHRITAAYPGEVVLQRQVQHEATPVLRMRSPKVEQQ
jgi:hypothetical protein